MYGLRMTRIAQRILPRRRTRLSDHNPAENPLQHVRLTTALRRGVSWSLPMVRKPFHYLASGPGC
jgi:hypothetical protein